MFGGKPEESKESEVAKVPKTQAALFFEAWESRATNWRSALAFINKVDAKSSGQVVWRGETDSSYALHSTLYRYLLEKKQDETPRGEDVKLPTEDEMVEAENKILEVARKQWRFDNLNALEAFAQIRHYGGPTRFLDVSFNPLIALWFAVEEKEEKECDSKGEPKKDADVRLFAFDIAHEDSLQLNKSGSRYEIPWEKHSKTWEKNGRLTPLVFGDHLVITKESLHRTRPS